MLYTVIHISLILALGVFIYLTSRERVRKKKHEIGRGKKKEKKRDAVRAVFGPFEYGYDRVREASLIRTPDGARLDDV